MNHKMKMFLTLGIGLIIIAITLILYFVGFSSTEKTTLSWVAFLFVLIAEIALICGLILMNFRIKSLNETLLKAGILSSLSIYFVITVLLTIFKGFFAQHMGAFITTQVAVCGIVAIVVMALLISASTKT